MRATGPATRVKPDVPCCLSQEFLPQVYDERVQGYCNLDEDVEIERPGRGEIFRIDVRLTALASGNPLISDDETSPSAVKIARNAPVMANPGPIALYAFSFTTLMLMLIQSKITEGSALTMVIGYALIHGGLLQLVVGIIEIFRNNLFGATAFSGYGAFWIGWGVTEIVSASGLLDNAEPFPAAQAGYFAVWGFFTAVLFVQTLFINCCMQAILFLISLALFLLSAGVFYPGATLAGGILGIMGAIVAFYTATAELYNDFGNLKLPLFHVSGAREEFGNSQAGRGKILAATDPAENVPLRARYWAYSTLATGGGSPQSNKKDDLEAGRNEE